MKFTMVSSRMLRNMTCIYPPPHKLYHNIFFLSDNNVSVERVDGELPIVNRGSLYINSV